METVAELFRRRRKGGALGIVSTAVIGDATPGTFTSHAEQCGTVLTEKCSQRLFVHIQETVRTSRKLITLILLTYMRR